MAANEKPSKPTGAPRGPVLIEYLNPDGTPEGEMTDEELAFNSFREEFVASETYGKITVYRQPTGFGGRASRNKLVYLFECGIDEYSFSQLLSKLRDEYGTGTYRLQGRDAEGSMKFNRSVDIETMKRATPETPPQNNTTEIMDAVTRMFQGSQERTEALIARISQGRGVPAADPGAQMITMFTGLIGALSPIIIAMMSRPAAAGAPPVDFMGELAKFGKVKEVLEGLAGGGGGGETTGAGFYDLAGKLVESFGPIVGAAVSSGQLRLPTPGASAPHARQMPPQNTAPPGPTSQPIPEVTGATPMAPRNAPPQKNPIKGQVDILLLNAKGGATPEQAAIMVVDNTPDEKLVALKAFVSKPDVLALMKEANPEVLKFEPWFTELRTQILSLIAEIESDNNAPDSATGAPSGAAVTAPAETAATPGEGVNGAPVR